MPRGASWPATYASIAAASKRCGRGGAAGSAGTSDAGAARAGCGAPGAVKLAGAAPLRSHASAETQRPIRRRAHVRIGRDGTAALAPPQAARRPPR